MQVLLLEDEDAIRAALVRGLERVGHRLHAAASLVEARQILADFRPELLITDLKLPDGSGLELAAELSLPFIVMSGYAAFDDAVQALRLGCVDFFTKPVSIHDLRACLERHQPQREVSATRLLVPDESLLVQGNRSGLSRQRVESWSLCWYNQQEARDAFDAASDAARGLRARQVLAELMQASQKGRVVVNRYDGHWIAWLDAPPDEAGNEERRELLETLADRCFWRGDGVLVELSHE